MDARELRIGNYIGIIHAGIEIKIIAEHIKFIAEGDTSYKPIPLTEEWLLKFGFEINHGTPNNSNAIYTDFEYRTKDFRIYLDQHPKDCSLHYNAINDWYPEISEFKFVHQLQNLYFALTGEELTITN